jgi:hypothetical protein
MARFPVVRFTDPDIVHCSLPNRLGCFPTVVVTGSPVSCFGHVNTIHMMPGGTGCVPHWGALMPIITTVIAGKLPIGSLFDPVAGCTMAGVSLQTTVSLGI